MPSSPLSTTVRSLLTPGRGILAADESLPTIGKRFKAFAIPSTEENRRAYRELLFTAPALNKSISGAILFDETIRQKTSAGLPMADFLTQQGIVPGIKVDKSTTALPGFDGEKITEGLDGLRDRLAEYYTLGARFTKWRAVIAIAEDLPTRTCIESNAHALARFAALSQEAGLVPIVEPEVLMDGAHSLERCEEVTTDVLRIVFATLAAQRVSLEGMLLKTGMVLSGADDATQADVPTVAAATLRTLRRTVPVAVPGVVFLSGGQSDETATQHLEAICQPGHTPWTLSFSFGRALQTPALETWKGSSANVRAAQDALLACARRNSAALHAR